MRLKSLLLTSRLPLFALISGCIATYDYYFNPTTYYHLASFFLPFTVILTILLVRRLPNLIPEPEQAAGESFRVWRLLLCLVGLLCFWIIGQIHTPFTPIWTFLYKLPHQYQYVLWVLGMALVTWGISGGLPIRRIPQILRQWASDSDSRWLLMIILLGFVVRIVLLDSAVPNYIDEALFAKGIVALRHYSDIKIMSSMHVIANFTWVFAYGQYIFTELFGATTSNLRALSVIVGTLTIPAVYLLGRWAFTRRVGLLSAFLLAIDLPHIHFSRLAMNNIADPLFGVLAIAFLWRGLQRRSWRLMACGGVCLGMTSYFYEGGRLLYLALIIAWLIIYIVSSKGRVFKRGILIFWIAMGLVASGFYLPYTEFREGPVAPRLSSEMIANEYWYEILTDPSPVTKYFEERLTAPYLHIVSEPDGSRFYYSSHDAIVLPYLLPLLFIGLGVVLYDWRRLGLIFLLWIILTIAGNSLIWSHNWTPRFVVVFPALVVLIALGLDTIYHSISDRWHNQINIQKKLHRFALIGMIVSGSFQLGYYFVVMLPAYNSVNRIDLDLQDATMRAQALLPETEVYILPIKNTFSAYIADLQAFERHINAVTIVQSDEFRFERLRDRPLQRFGFFVDPGDLDTLVTLQYIFGEDLKGSVFSPYNVPEDFQFALYHVNQ
jgi:4-amino-4-deoxy-L-arabinose transferase-like glycosyltransferase